MYLIIYNLREQYKEAEESNNHRIRQLQQRRRFSPTLALLPCPVPSHSANDSLSANYQISAKGCS